MENYHKDYLTSRGFSIGDQIFCELCGKLDAQIHHILSSFRGKRKNNADGTDVIALCPECHEYVHAHNTQTMRKSLMYIVACILFK